MKPILFNTPMVQAILEGRKTQTRRVIKPQPNSKAEYKGTEIGKHVFETDIDMWHIKSPYQPGQVLWVRETWSMIDDMPYDNYVYRTDYGTTEDDSFPPSMFKWKPSIHMPREAARIFLRVKTVRVERVQDITAHDAIREGMESEIPFDTVDEFKELWNNLNAKRGYGWESNPWVWVVKFERMSKEEAPLKESEVEHDA
jgi:hypothetical protein